MNWTVPEIAAHVLTSLRSPRRAAAEFMEWDIPDKAIAPLVLVSAILFALGSELVSAMNPPAPGQPYVYIAPIFVVLLLLGTLLIMSMAISVIGQAFGGTGNFMRALLVMSWVQFVWFWIFLPLSLFPLPATVIEVLTLLALIYMLWVMSAFVAALHGLKRIGMAFLVVFLASLIASVVFMALVGSIGLTILGEAAYG